MDHRVRADRRYDRLQLSSCENCGTLEVRVATRTEYVVYVRCLECMHVWSVVKPDHRSAAMEPSGSFIRAAR
jgi:hypothetical protein